MMFVHSFLNQFLPLQNMRGYWQRMLSSFDQSSRGLSELRGKGFVQLDRCSPYSESFAVQDVEHP